VMRSRFKTPGVARVGSLGRVATAR
jgi:hypothetical protein